MPLPSALHVPVPRERWVDGVELARIMGLSHSTIKRFRKDGMPSENWGMARTRRYQPSKCIAWAQSRDQTRTIPARRDRDDDSDPDQRQPKE